MTEAGDGQAALERLSGPGQDYDLILLDLLMPRMDGMELLRRLRADGNIVPVVILTAHGSIPEAVEAMKLGAIDFLTKPITPDALRRVVAEVIERHAARTAPVQPAETSPKPLGSLQADRVRPRTGQASHQSRPVQRGGSLAPRPDRPRSPVDRSPRAPRSAADS